jgi:hypothetical protein
MLKQWNGGLKTLGDTMIPPMPQTEATATQRWDGGVRDLTA